MNILREVAGSSPSMLPFIIGMGITVFVFYGISIWSKRSEEKKNSDIPDSRESYNFLKENVNDSWSLISKNNRLYLGALIVGFTVQRLGQWSGHPIFGSSLVIAFTYFIAFMNSFKHLMQGKLFDQQIMTYSIKGMQMEKEHPEWKVDFFHRFVNENYQGFGLFSLTLFRVVVLAWVLFSAIDFGVLSRFSDTWSTLKIAFVSTTVFMLTALLLWKIGCHSYYVLGAKTKE
jgi:hypothetical protein